jgi:hypothetical protein
MAGLIAVAYATASIPRRSIDMEREGYGKYLDQIEEV